MVACSVLALRLPLLASRQTGREEAQKRQVVGRACKAYYKLHGGSQISQKVGFNRQPIAQKGRASVPLGGVSAAVHSRTPCLQ